MRESDSAGGWRTAALAYAALIVYASLFPFSGWKVPPSGVLVFVKANWSHYAGYGDMATNVLAYAPLGLMVTFALWRRLGFVGAGITSIVAGAALSLTVEIGQTFLPTRVPSVIDLLTNTTGAAVGAAMAVVASPSTGVGRWLTEARYAFFRPGATSTLGLVVLGVWVMSQISPFLPSLDLGNLRQGLSPLAKTVNDLSRFRLGEAVMYALQIVSLGLIVEGLANPSRRLALAWLGAAGAVLLLKVPIVGRQLSLEAVVGWLAAAPTLLLAARTRASTQRLTSACFLLFVVVLAESLPVAAGGTVASTRGLNWIPFAAQINLVGLLDLLGGMWPFLALGYLARVGLWSPSGAWVRSASWVALVGGVLLAAIMFALEWRQQGMPGRTPDITDVIVAVGAWFVAFFAGARDPASAPESAWPATDIRAESRAPGGGGRRERRRARSRRLRITGAVVVFASLALGVSLLARPPLEEPLDESQKPRLPSGDELPPVRLPGFRSVHPRLPAPSHAEIARLRVENPRYLEDARRSARGGEGSIDAALLMALVEPGSQNLEVIHRRLMALKYTWRGHEQAKPVAVAYDWLYEQWSAGQRRALAEKLAEGADYLVKRIREDRLSPYNVYLYNSPLQALVASAIALYGDHPRGEAAMRFTHDYVINRLLPVWRQVMGRNGGWHEGGEYVGIGIGQAIFQIPNMWRAATGEDLFAREPGIGGFLDFVTYRKRPDGTDFRLGDAAFFDRIVPDVNPLALEFRHAAAYSQRAPGNAIAPTSWPWGPLSDASLADPTAVTRLPLARHFDGVGLVVARSDWTPQATYVTFKAGDHYWSHMHLDQGSFTIYKGGGLALDSGVYGSAYGSDHHMNYSIQSVAHNLVTVTDPNDTVPMPARKEKPPRPIANDGGQRRVGSGWGIEAAPLDLDEWNAKRDVYHTGRIESFFDAEGLVVAVADVTPAYTNDLSGRGTFSHRTRRVERLWRVFAYDQVDDVVVVWDDVRSRRPSFRKRWLLHTTLRPRVAGNTFEVVVPPAPVPGRGGGRLTGHILLPKSPSMVAIGGRGFEFFVDVHNYDDGGKVQVPPAEQARGPEPGGWRFELMPAEDAREDQFLVVMLPSPLDGRPTHVVKRIEDGERVGCEIVGPSRTTRWWFTPRVRGVTVEVGDAGGVRRRQIGTMFRYQEEAGLRAWISRLTDELMPQ